MMSKLVNKLLFYLLVYLTQGIHDEYRGCSIQYSENAELSMHYGLYDDVRAEYCSAMTSGFVSARCIQ